MIKIDDVVTAKNPELPYPMVVIQVREEYELVSCKFLISGNFAGDFQMNELIVRHSYDNDVQCTLHNNGTGE